MLKDRNAAKRGLKRNKTRTALQSPGSFIGFKPGFYICSMGQKEKP